MYFLRLPFTMLLIMYQSAFVALGQIWANKVRSILTTIGIVIGVASVTAVIAALTGLKTKLLAEFESIGTNKIFIFPYYAGRRAMSFQRIRFRNEHFEGLMEHCPSVSGLTRMMNWRGDNVTFGTRSEQNVDVQGIDPAWHKIENRSVALGRRFSLGDVQQCRPVCIVNDKTRDKLGLALACIGQSILVGKGRYLMVGGLEPHVGAWMFGGENNGLEIFLPFTTLQRQQPWSNFPVVAASRSPGASEDALAEIKFFLRKSRRVRVGEPDTLRGRAVQEFVNKLQTIA